VFEVEGSSIFLVESSTIMPHLIMCNRYWRVSGDELPVTAVCAIAGRIVALAFFTALFSLTNNDTRFCHSGFITFVTASITAFALSILVECTIIYAGLQVRVLPVSARVLTVCVSVSIPHTNHPMFFLGHCRAPWYK